jgi:putative ABC transport system permease protein
MAKKGMVRNRKKRIAAVPRVPHEAATQSRVLSFSRTSALVSLKLGFFLARRQIGRGNVWTTLLITLVMTLTFLNLVFIGGILVGLIEGAAGANRTHYSSDLLISARSEKPYIEESPSIIERAESLPWTEALSARYVGSGTIETGYKERTNYTDIANETSGLIAGIRPSAEARVSLLNEKIVEGAYLRDDDADGVLIGTDKLAQYLPIDTPFMKTLKDVAVGNKVRIRVGENMREFTVRGFVNAKVNEVDSRIIMLDTSLRDLLGRSDKSVNEIAVKLHEPNDAFIAKEALLASGVGDRARVQTWEDAQPKFIKDIQKTFRMLGNIVGSIGLVVASITIFIVVFINAITRRKFIGILRGIGVSALAIEISYVLQAFFYATIGTIIGALLLYLGIQPWIFAHPIDFPFSDGILVAPFLDTSIRAFLLLLASLIAGYVPAQMIIRQNPLDAILGR